MSTRCATPALMPPDVPAPRDGAFLDMTRGMKPVTCAVEEFPGANGVISTASPQGKMSPEPEIFPRHVLVVDDEPLIRWSVTEALVDMGLDAEEATDAQSALRAVTTAARPFDAVVMDLRLPDMNDLSLLGTVRQLLPKATLILMTAYSTPEIVADARAMGAKVVNKPFELDELKQLIAN
jgi:CheY-like chemotaxis protein